MRNVTLPLPVFLAGVVMCLLAGYLLGMVTGPNATNTTLAQVSSSDTSTQKLCLTGNAVKSQEGAKDGELCGVWRRTVQSQTPVKGDDFRFVSVATSGEYGGKTRTQVVIYGDVIKK